MTGSPRVGLFGFLGSGNIGNDASMEAMLGYLRADHPGAIVDAMCMGPEQLRSRYAIAAIPLNWCRKYERRVPRAAVPGVKVLGKFVDAFRIAAWVRRHDVVIVPGMGVLETTLPLRALGGPYALFLLCACGRVFGTKVALVSVGANVSRQRLTRWLYRSAARLAFYCSFRDTGSLEAMRPRGRRSGPDLVYPDLAFCLPAPTDLPGDPRIVGIGVMDFHGTNDDRRRAGQIYASYVRQIKAFVLWLLDNGHSIRLFVGDTAGCDDEVIAEILGYLKTERPDLRDGQVVAEPSTSFADLMHAMAPAGAIVAARYHNLICSLLLAKPTISIGYAAKHRALMAGMGLSDFCQPADGLDSDQLIQQFTELRNRSAELRVRIAERNAAHAGRLADQFAALSARLFPARAGTGEADEPGPIRVRLTARQSGDGR